MSSAYVAMFDEVDEGTAIFKVTNHPPRQAHFVTLDGLPSDWYLRLTGEGARLLREESRFLRRSLLRREGRQVWPGRAGFETNSFRARCWKP